MLAMEIVGLERLMHCCWGGVVGVSFFGGGAASTSLPDRIRLVCYQMWANVCLGVSIASIYSARENGLPGSRSLNAARQPSKTPRVSLN